MKRILLALMFALGFPAHGAHFTTSVAQAIGANWNDAIWQPGPTVATVGNTYEVLSGGLVRNPIVVSSTFPGDLLQLDTNSIFRMKPPADGTTTTVKFPGVNGAAGLILNGGGIDPGSPNTTFVVAGKVLVTADSLMLGPTVDSNRNVIFTAALSGTRSITVQNFFNNSGITVQSASNDFSGNWIVKSGRLTGVGNGALGSGNFVVNAGSRLEILYDITTAGALFLNGTMALTRNCQFSGVSINGTNLLAGTYSYDDLKNRFPTNFVANGSGSITVVPRDVSLSILPSGSTISIQFQTGIGHDYILQTRPDLDSSTPWIAVTAPIPGDGSIKSITQNPSDAAAFYRVQIE